MTSRTASMLGAAGSAVMGSEEHGLAVRAEHRLQSVPDLVEGAVGPSAIEHRRDHIAVVQGGLAQGFEPLRHQRGVALRDRKSTRLNSSHLVISYAVFCLKKKKKTKQTNILDRTNHRRC